MSIKIVRILSAASLATALLIGASPVSAQAVTQPRHGHVQAVGYVAGLHGSVHAPMRHRHHHRVHHNRAERRYPRCGTP